MDRIIMVISNSLKFDGSWFVFRNKHFHSIRNVRYFVYFLFFHLPSSKTCNSVRWRKKMSSKDRERVEGKTCFRKTYAIDQLQSDYDIWNEKNMSHVACFYGIMISIILCAVCAMCAHSLVCAVNLMKNKSMHHDYVLFEISLLLTNEYVKLWRWSRAISTVVQYNSYHCIECIDKILNESNFTLEM